MCIWVFVFLGTPQACQVIRICKKQSILIYSQSNLFLLWVSIEEAAKKKKKKKKKKKTTESSKD